MNRTASTVIAICAMTFSLPGAAQLVALQDRPLSAAERTRMTVLEAQFSRISMQRNTSFAALRTIARALGTKLTALDPDQVLKIVDDRAQELVKARSRIQEMQGQLDQLDSMRLAKAVSPLLDAAKLAIDQGRLSDADAQLAQAAARFGEARGNLQEHVEQIGAQEADVLAQQAGVRNSLSDFTSAATLYAKAAELSEAKRPQVAWGFRMEQAAALYNNGMSGQVSEVEASLTVLNTRALPLAPRETRREDWGATQYRVGSTEMYLSQLTGDVAVVEKAVAALRLSVAAISPQTPKDERVLRRTRLGFALGRLSFYTDSPVLMDEAVALMKDIEITEQPDSADFYSDYADVFSALSIKRYDAGRYDADKVEQAIVAGQTALDATGKALARIDQTTRARFYYQTQYNLASQTISLALLRSSPGDAAKATEIAESGIKSLTRDRNPLMWGLFQYVYGQSVIMQNRLQPDVPDDRLDAAIAALTAAGEELSEKKMPSFYRQIQHQRAIGLSLEAHRNRTPDAYAAAFAALDAAGRLYSKEKNNTQWADIKVRTAALKVEQGQTSNVADRQQAFDGAKQILAEVKPELDSTDRDVRALYTNTAARLN